MGMPTQATQTPRTQSFGPLLDPLSIDVQNVTLNEFGEIVIGFAAHNNLNEAAAFANSRVTLTSLQVTVRLGAAQIPLSPDVPLVLGAGDRTTFALTVPRPDTRGPVEIEVEGTYTFALEASTTVGNDSHTISLSGQGTIDLAQRTVVI
jgi:hypothetical protein